MLGYVWVPLAIAALVTSGGDEPANKELARLEGVWRFARVDVNGAEQPSSAFPANEMIVLKDGRYLVVQGARITHGMVRLDPSTRPKRVDVKLTEGAAKGRSIGAIYDLSPDTYRVCGFLSGTQRPATFASAPGSGTILHVMKRESVSLRSSLVTVYRTELTGTWQGTSFEREGTRASEAQLADIQLVIDADGNTRSLIGGKVFLAGPCTIDPTQDPMTLDVTYTEGVNKGRTSLGIFKIEDGVLTICRRPPDKPRPTDFKSGPVSGAILISYKHVKPQPAK